MSYALELLLDAEATRKIRSLWRRISPIDDSMQRLNFSPHLSLGICEALERPAFDEALAEWAAEVGPIPVQFPALGAFPPRVLFLSPSPTEALMALHRSFYARFKVSARRPSGWYAPDRWLPHCTLADQLDAERLGAAVAALSETWAPIRGTIEAVQLSHFPPAGLCQLLPLGGGWRIRPAVESDAGALAALHVRAWRAAYAELIPDAYLDGLDVEAWTERNRRYLGRGAALVIEADGALQGFSMYGPERPEPGEDDRAVAWEIYAIYLEPTAWGRGLGRALMARTAEELARSGAPRGRLWVLADNPRARRFYEAAGWSADGGEKTITIGGVALSEVRYTSG